MKHIIIIANLYHASPRMPLLAKYIEKRGWHVTIVTNKINLKKNYMGLTTSIIKNSLEIVETDEELMEKDVRNILRKKYSIKKGFWYYKIESIIKYLYKKYLEIKNYPDQYKKWEPFALKKINDIIEKNNIDAIISSSSPVTCHIVASKIKKKHNILWIADLRDLWTQNHNYQYGKIRKYFERKLELKTLKKADMLVTVTPKWVDSLKLLHNKKRVFSITNGFDPEKLKTNRKIKPTSRFTITYTGQIYTESQDFTIILKVINELIINRLIDKKDIEVKFYGKIREQLQKAVNNYKLDEIVKQYGVIPWEEIYEKQAETQVLLLFAWGNKCEKGWYPLKLFEYLSAKRPILVTGGLGSDLIEELIEDTNTGTYCRNTADVKKAILEYYSEYKDKKEVSYQGNIEKISKYSFERLAEKYIDVIENN